MGPVTESQSSEWFNLLFALLFLFVGYAICIAHVSIVDTGAAIVLVSQMVTLVWVFVLVAVVLGLLSGSDIISWRYLSECLKDYTASKDARRSPLQSTSNSPMVNFLDWALPATPTTGRVLANGTRIEGEGRNIWTENRNSLGSMPSLVGNMSPNTTTTTCPSPITPLSGNSPLNTPLTIESPVGSPSPLDEEDPLTRVRRLKNMLIEHTAKTERRRREHARRLKELEELTDAADVPVPEPRLALHDDNVSPLLENRNSPITENRGSLVAESVLVLATPLPVARTLGNAVLETGLNGAVVLVGNSGCNDTASCTLTALFWWFAIMAAQLALGVRSAYYYYSLGKNGGLSLFVQDSILDVMNKYVLVRRAQRSSRTFYSGYYNNSDTKCTGIVQFAKSGLEDNGLLGQEKGSQVEIAPEVIAVVVPEEFTPAPVEVGSRPAAPVSGLKDGNRSSEQPSEEQMISSFTVSYTFEDLVSQLAYMEEETFEVYEDWAYAVDVLFGESGPDTPRPSCESGVSEEEPDKEVEEVVDLATEEEIIPGQVKSRFFEDFSESASDLSISFNDEGSGAPTWEDTAITAQRRFAMAWAVGSVTNLSRGATGFTAAPSSAAGKVPSFAAPARFRGQATNEGEDVALEEPVSMPSKVVEVVMDLKSAADGNKKSPCAAPGGEIARPPESLVSLGRAREGYAEDVRA